MSNKGRPYVSTLFCSGCVDLRTANFESSEPITMNCISDRWIKLAHEWLQERFRNNVGCYALNATLAKDCSAVWAEAFSMHAGVSLRDTITLWISCESGRKMPQRLRRRRQEFYSSDDG